MSAALAVCRSVSVVHGHGDVAVTALGNVDFVVSEGERVALRGRSGSGKTTLLHVLGGLIEPTSGVVEWRGKPLSTLDAAARTTTRAGGIAYVFQAANLLPHFTAFENVAFAVDAAITAEVPPTLTTDELLALVGLSEKADSLPGELSGGEAQRVAIARALGQSPRLLLCDEPTGHLDTDTRDRILDMLEAIQREFGFALVLATHDPEVAARLDRVVELKDGHVVAEAMAA